MYFRSNYNDLEQLSGEQFAVVLEQLIDKEIESEFLDFKQEVHTNNAELMKDIISLANNVNEVDGLLIFGVQDRTKQIVGVNFPKFEEHINNVLEGNRKKLAGQSLPKIYVRSATLNGMNVETIIIKNSTKTPFYLIDSYRDQSVIINPYEVYTRRLSNKGLASDVEIEKLWAKRFGLSKTSLDKFLHLSNLGWRFVKKNSKNYADKYVFNENNPEYTIRFSEAKGLNNYPYSKTLNIFNGYEKNYKGRLQVLYHSVVIFEDDYYFMKDCEYSGHNQRYIPKFEEIVIIDMKYYLLDTIQGKLVRILNNGKLDFYNGRNALEYGHYLVFYNENDLIDFTEYLIELFEIKIEAYDKYDVCSSFDMYLHQVFSSDEYNKNYEAFVDEATAQDFTSLPENFVRLLSEHKNYIDAPTFKPELHNILEKVFVFVLYANWKNIQIEDYNIFLESMN